MFKIIVFEKLVLVEIKLKIEVSVSWENCINYLFVWMSVLIIIDVFDIELLLNYMFICLVYF